MFAYFILILNEKFKKKESQGWFYLRREFDIYPCKDKFGK